MYIPVVYYHHPPTQKGSPIGIGNQFNICWFQGAPYLTVLQKAMWGWLWRCHVPKAASWDCCRWALVNWEVSCFCLKLFFLRRSRARRRFKQQWWLVVLLRNHQLIIMYTYKNYIVDKIFCTPWNLWILFLLNHLYAFMVSCHECSINLATTLLKPTHPTTCSRSSNAAAGCHTSSGTINETRCAWEVSLWWKESTGKPTGDGLYTGTWGGRLNKSFPKKRFADKFSVRVVYRQ